MDGGAGYSGRRNGLRKGNRERKKGGREIRRYWERDRDATGKEGLYQRKRDAKGKEVHRGR